MAERYGTIPKRFTKKWWEYFWEYYMWHTITVLAVLVAIISTVYGAVTAPKYDFFMTYATDVYIDDEALKKAEAKLCEYIEDTNKDDKRLVSSSCYAFSENEQEYEYLKTMITKLHLDFVGDEVMLFIFSEDKAKYYFDSTSLTDVFVPVRKWLGVESDDLKTYSFYGEDYAISLENSKILKDAGIDCSDMYVAVRAYEAESDEVNSRIRSAYAVANELIK